MPKLDELNLDPKAAPDVDMENLPEEFGDFTSPPYPGSYTFQLPHELDFEPYKVKIDDKEVERVRVNFDNAHPLLVVAATPENVDEVGKMITMYRIGNAEYSFTRKGEKVTTSEMAHLLKGAFGQNLPKGATNQQYAAALDAVAGQMFGCEVQWESYCNPDKKRWIMGKDEKRAEDTVAGCGRRYAQSGYTKGDGTVVYDIPKETGEGDIGEFFADEFPCQCGGLVRARARLKRYGPVVIRPTAG